MYSRPIVLFQQVRRFLVRFFLKLKLVLNNSLTYNYCEKVKEKIKSYLLNTEKTAKLAT